MSNYLYVIGEESGPVKIGITSSMKSRLSALQTGCPFPLRVLRCFEMATRLDAVAYEEDFHSGNDYCRLMGEWFNCEAAYAIDWIESKIENDIEFGAEPLAQ